MSGGATWLLVPEKGTLDEPFDRAVMVPFDFERCRNLMRAMDQVSPTRDYTTVLPRARLVEAATWEEDVVPHAACFPRTLRWPPGCVVELPVEVLPGASTPAEQTLSAFWARWTFGAEQALAAPFNGARLATFLFGLARTGDEIVETVRYFDDYSTRFLRVVLTQQGDLSGDERWAQIVLSERWPDGLPAAVWTELLQSSDRSLREYAIQRLPERTQGRRLRGRS